MGLAGLHIISQALIDHGRSPETPIAVVEKATLPNQRVITATLASINQRVAEEKPEAPTLLIIGDVVRLHSELNWYSPSA
jgi:uroporphyrin-III C-methyltransferase/precorrin-2 dehydrogenase/sirohydrochlorin ferrochelatase